MQECEKVNESVYASLVTFGISLTELLFLSLWKHSYNKFNFF